MDNSELLKFLELASQKLRHHHDALWEEKKHYTWWIYIVFGGLIYLYVNQSLCPWQKITLIALGSIFGIFISYIGYTVVRREGEFFHEAIQIRDRTLIALGLDQPKGPQTSLLMPPLKIKDFDSVRSGANKPLVKLLTGFPTFKLGIRDYFQLTFVMTTLMFVFFCIFSAVTLS